MNKRAAVPIHEIVLYSVFTFFTFEVFSIIIIYLLVEMQFNIMKRKVSILLHMITNDIQQVGIMVKMNIPFSNQLHGLK